MRRAGQRGQARFERISWEAALDAVHERFTDIIAAHGPQAILPLNYAGTASSPAAPWTCASSTAWARACSTGSPSARAAGRQPLRARRSLRHLRPALAAASGARHSGPGGGAAEHRDLPPPRRPLRVHRRRLHPGVVACLSAWSPVPVADRTAPPVATWHANMNPACQAGALRTSSPQFFHAFPARYGSGTAVAHSARAPAAGCRERKGDHRWVLQGRLAGGSASAWPFRAESRLR